MMAPQETNHILPKEKGKDTPFNGIAQKWHILLLLKTCHAAINCSNVKPYMHSLATVLQNGYRI